MKYAIASDIHGSAYWCTEFMRALKYEKVDKIILLGDLMYHGPRNPLPQGYDPSNVAQQLNGLPLEILAVRGNCDSEVDQMLLDFPCMQNYALIEDSGTSFLCTHGHLELSNLIDALPQGSIVFSGHTHIKRDETIKGIRYLNPGSISLPKDRSHSYLIYEDGIADFREL